MPHGAEATADASSRAPRGARSWRLLPFVLVAGLTLIGASTSTAVTVQPERIAADSYYVDSSSTSLMREAGCSQGFVDTADEGSSAVILDFGGQLGKRTGTEAAGGGNGDFTNAQIESLAEAFSEGYYECIASEAPGSVRVIIGTNNSKESVSKAGGKAWADVVKTVAAKILESPDEATRVAIWGGDDIEVGYSNASPARTWAKGYSETTASPYVDYGDAAGCPLTTHKNGKCESSGTKGWNQKIEYEVSWEIKGANPSPEIYYNPPPGTPSNAEEWAQIDLYGAGKMHFIGVLDQHGDEASNTTQQAYEQLYGQLTANDLFSEIPFSLSIAFEETSHVDDAAASLTPGHASRRTMASFFTSCMGPFAGYPQEKLTPLEEECHARAVAAGITPAEEDTLKARSSEAASQSDAVHAAAEGESPPTRPTGLKEGPEGPAGTSQTFDAVNNWVGEVDDHWYQVYAGAKMLPGTNVNAGSELLLYSGPANFQSGEPPTFVGSYVPPGGGSEPLRLLGATGNTLEVQTSSGAPTTFDVATQAFTP